MEVAQAKGWKVMGLELGQIAYEYARGRGLDVRQQFLEELSDEDGFDAVTAFSLMEHLNDPGSFVRAARERLKAGGVFAAISPNTYSLASMILREKMPTFDGRNHLQYYTLDSFRRLFQQNGYTVVHLDTVLTALANVKKYIQYQDPYGEDAQGEFLPEPIRAFFGGSRQQELEAFMYQNHLGLRLRLVAKRLE
jgi:SAM-dependent methyltransferase